MDHEPHVHHGPGVPTEARRLSVVAAVIWHEDRLLLTRRPPGGPLGLMWEFPGGKVEPGETAEHAIAREIREELGVEATPREVLGVDTHDYEHGLEVEIVFLRCTLESMALQPGPGVHGFAWLRPAEVNLSTVLAADRDFLIGLGAPPLVRGSV